MSEMCKKRGRSAIMEKLLSLGVVEDRKDLYKKRASKSGARSRQQRAGSDDSNDEGMGVNGIDY